MILTVEISFYPFNQDYIPPIKWFIERLASYPEIERRTTATCTQIQGESQQIMTLLHDEMTAAFEKYGKAVMVCKFIPGPLNLNYQDETEQEA
ncbi:hypothetical protein [Paraferrimonas sedimenticola]|uniref:YKOF-related Family n=1 Tax=Paraferrimonas sedimenticola TaxID=375674 RepID=A0AA37VWN7_9GAMM|nr:hypothetical protein [Paraferrimonas sedimenticola]GLP96446.1 hypothetical protein GCM10007895_17520 [Paraferrimonas sedimenticola]